MDIKHIKAIRRVIRDKVKSGDQWHSQQESPEQTNERVNREHFGGGHVVLRLHGRDRVYHTPKQAGRLDLPSEALADIYGEEAGHQVLGHNNHPGGHVHVDLPEGSHQGTHHQNYGERPAVPGLAVSRFRHLGREVVEHHNDYPQAGEHMVSWSVLHPKRRYEIYFSRGIAKTERDAREKANDKYHQWHAEQSQISEFH